MANVPDSITLKQLCKKAAEALVRAGLDRRIDIYRDVEIDDPAVQLMLGRTHRLRVRVKITASSLLSESPSQGGQPDVFESTAMDARDGAMTTVDLSGPDAAKG
jgi:hypothetical protein